MIIESYGVKASSQRTYLSIQSTTMSAKRELRATPASIGTAGNENGVQDKASISDSAKRLLKKLKEDSQRYLAQKAETPNVRKASYDRGHPKTPEDLKTRFLELMLELLTGKKTSAKAHTPVKPTFNMPDPPQLDFSSPVGVSSFQIADGFSFEHFSYESEIVSYEAQGVINTADGKTISVDINMYMSRETATYFSSFVEAKKPIDPLVINYGGLAESLTGEKFDFDLTMDGILDKVPVLGEGFGFLALDKNGDGKINDGSELFGPGSGNGFEELRAYDLDGNNWIDEADDVFSKLRIWSIDKYGNEQLFTLKELGIGAIYLGDISTEFSFKDDSSQTMGVMRSTSFFLGENGSAGTVSHIDMVV